MYVCMYVCKYVSMHVCMYVCMNECIVYNVCTYIHDVYTFLHVSYAYFIFNTCEGEATRLAELALIFIPTVFIALSAKYRSKLHINRDKNKSQFRQTCCLPFTCFSLYPGIFLILLSSS